MDNRLTHPPTPPDFAIALASLATETGDKLKLRNQVSALARKHLDEVRQTAEADLIRDGWGTACAEYLAAAEDNLITSLFQFAARAFGASATASGLSVIAVGGYGRGTLAPGSDIDLLFLTQGSASPEINAFIEFMLYALCLLYTSPSPRDGLLSRMPSSA